MLPDTYRGDYRRDMADAAHRYADSVREHIEYLAEAGARPAAFIAESLGGVSGQMILPPGYLEAAYGHVRAAGGICIADEVQVGLGRMGTVMWGFQTQGVVPDIVTIGKPLGNGHPLAAVITTAAIAESFNTGMEYFNTFGGNPVSCAIGLAVLNAIDTDGLMDNARQRGEQIMGGLSTLARHHPLIGDVRGIGLFIGAELVRDRDTLEPATIEARELVEYVKNRGILLSTDGHHDNVLKIKPPMCLDAEDVEFFLAHLDEGLRYIGQARR
jgi:4-aminobutyrate aminotransferase-like enzyme